MRAKTLAIEAPCQENWDRMRSDADGQRRWCEQCERHVHDLSKMTERAARALLRTEADVCIAYVEDEQGEIVFAPERAPQAAFVPLARLASAATIAMLLGACTPHGEPQQAVQVESEQATMLTPASVIPCESPAASERAPEVASAVEAVAEPPRVPARIEPVKGKRVRTMGKPPLRDDLLDL